MLSLSQVRFVLASGLSRSASDGNSDGDDDHASGDSNAAARTDGEPSDSETKATQDSNPDAKTKSAVKRKLGEAGKLQSKKLSFADLSSPTALERFQREEDEADRRREQKRGTASAKKDKKPFSSAKQPSFKFGHSSKVLPMEEFAGGQGATSDRDRGDGGSEGASVSSRSTVTAFHKAIEHGQGEEDPILRVLRYLLAVVSVCVIALSVVNTVIFGNVVGQDVRTGDSIALAGQRAVAQQVRVPSCTS